MVVFLLDFWGWLAFSGDRTVLSVWNVLFLRVFPGNTSSGSERSYQEVFTAESHDLCLSYRIRNYILIMTLHIRY